MSIWLQILEWVTRRETTRVRQALDLDLPMALREFVAAAQDARRYAGVLPRAVRRFAAQLPAGERALLRSYECEFVDTLLDNVCAEVERTVQLLELCYAHPTATPDDLLPLFPWAHGLKRSAEWKRARLAQYLASFAAAGLVLPINFHCTTTLPLLPFHEVAYAVAPKRLEQSWRAFKEQWEWSEDFIGIVMDESDEYAEGVDYSAIPLARVAAQAALRQETSLHLELRWLGQSLTPALHELVSEWQAAHQHDGYPPIAWHNVFWTLTEEYEALPLALDQREPQRATDQELAEHLSLAYPEVKSTSRPVVARRRKQLYEACAEKIVTRLRENFAHGEQTPWPITQESEERER